MVEKGYPSYEEMFETYCCRSENYRKKQKVEYNSVQAMKDVKIKVKEATEQVMEFISKTDENMRALI